MPTPKITLNLLVCASLALAAGVPVRAKLDPFQHPLQRTPQQTSPAPSHPSATGPTDPRCLRQHPQQHPGLPRSGPASRSRQGRRHLLDPNRRLRSPVRPMKTAPAVVTGKNGQTDPNVNPFPQAQPDKDGMMPGVKGGSIDDVNAVGTRNIGARGMGNWYSTESEIKMGKQYADEIEKSTKFITDPVVVEYVNRIGQNIVKNSDCKVPFTIKVIDTDEINAMALPGGFFYVNSGLILAADEEAELAGVMAHETAHVCAHHAAREMTRANYAQIGMVPLIMMTGYSWTGYGIYEATQLADPHHLPRVLPRV